MTINHLQAAYDCVSSTLPAYTMRNKPLVNALQHLQMAQIERDELVAALEQIAALAESDAPSRQENVRLVARATLAKVQS